MDNRRRHCQLDHWISFRTMCKGWFQVFSNIHVVIHVFYWSWIIESWIKNISDKWKWKDEYYGRVAKKILIPCNDGVGWLVKDWFFIVQYFYQFWSSLDSKSKIMRRSITLTKHELKSLTGLIQTKRKFI